MIGRAFLASGRDATDHDIGEVGRIGRMQRAAERQVDAAERRSPAALVAGRAGAVVQRLARAPSAAAGGAAAAAARLRLP